MFFILSMSYWLSFIKVVIHDAAGAAGRDKVIVMEQMYYPVIMN